jgi:hypothetical protein
MPWRRPFFSQSNIFDSGDAKSHRSDGTNVLGSKLFVRDDSFDNQQVLEGIGQIEND